MHGGEGSWFCLDSKYRVTVTNLSEAFESVHIYKDSLRYDGFGGRCRGCLLLSPSKTKDTDAWLSPSFSEEHKAGIWGLRPRVEGNPLARFLCSQLHVPVDLVDAWGTVVNGDLASGLTKLWNGTSV